jgi:hypothetical protein
MQHTHHGAMKDSGKGCCPSTSHGHKQEHSGDSLVSTSFHTTLHCLTGCVIGEVVGLAIGVHFALGMWPTMILATVLAYIASFSLAIPPIMRKQNLSFASAFKAIWLGEAISIGVMEMVMNWTDYMVGGVQAVSLASPIFYIGIAVAIPAGFIAAWPVNYWLLKKQIKGTCH